MPRLKKQQCHLVRARHLRNCKQRVKELSASAVKVIMQQRSQLSKGGLIGAQDNNDANAKISGELSDFENESDLEYTDEEYLSEDDLGLDSEEVSMLVLSTTVLDGIETLVEQENLMPLRCLVSYHYRAFLVLV
jgi:hypothetical protein